MTRSSAEPVALRNLLTDVAGLRVGHADDPRLKSGVTVVVCDAATIASVHVMGGAPGTRETDLLQAEFLVEAVDAIVLSGGSAFGLDAAGGVMGGLARDGRGYRVGSAAVPIVPAAILFDLLNGGDKAWGEEPPYRRLGAAAYASAGTSFALGSVGAGAGATTADLKGGIGSAATRLENGIIVAALAAVNAVGAVTIGDSGHFWAAAFEVGSEFGGRGLPHPLPADAARVRLKGLRSPGRPRENTTLAVVATDARLSKRDAKRLAVMAHDGLARAIFPVHTPIDGDVVFSIATGRTEAAPDIVALGSAAAATVARAIARGVFEATPAPGDLLPTWRQRFGAR
jgi:L-aminopeptidase/D-esterase-like protein